MDILKIREKNQTDDDNRSSVVTYIVDKDNNLLCYTEWLNDGGEVVDSVLRDKDGYSLESPVLIQEVREVVTSDS